MKYHQNKNQQINPIIKIRLKQNSLTLLDVLKHIPITITNPQTKSLHKTSNFCNESFKFLKLDI